MPELDGNIVIGAKIDKEEFKRDIEDLQKLLEENKAHVESLKSQYANFIDRKTKTKEQLYLEEEINQALKKRDDIASRLWGNKDLTPQKLSELNVDLENTNSRLIKLNNNLDRVKLNPSATRTVKDLSREIIQSERESNKLSNTITKKLELAYKEEEKAQSKAIAAAERLAREQEKQQARQIAAAERAAKEQARKEERIKEQAIVKAERLAREQERIQRRQLERLEDKAERANRERARREEREQAREIARADRFSIEKYRREEREQARAAAAAERLAREQARAAERANREQEKEQAKQAIERIKYLNEGIANLKHSISNFGNSFRNMFSSLIAPIKAVTDKIIYLGGRILKLGSYVLVFNVLRGGFRQFRDYLGATLMTNTKFMESLNQLKSNLMVAFYPIYQFILPALNTLMQVLVKVSGYVANFLSMITGISIQQSVAGAKSIYDAQQSMKSGSSSTTKSVKNEGKAFDELGKKAKGLKKELAPFDKLNILRQDKDKTKEPKLPKDGFVFTPELSIDPTYNNMVTIFDRINEKIQPLKDKFKGLGDTIQNTFGKFAKKALEDFYDVFAKPLAGWTVDRGLPEFVRITDNMFKNIKWDRLNDSLKEFWKVLEPFSEHVGEGLLWFYENVLSKLVGFTIDTVIPDTLDAIGKSLKFIDDTIGADNVIAGALIGIGATEVIKSLTNAIIYINKMKQAIEGLTTAQILLKAFSGPAGWTALAVGLSAAAILGIKKIRDIELNNMLEYNNKTRDEFELMNRRDQQKLWDSWHSHQQRILGAVTSNRKEAMDKMLKDTGITYEEFNRMDLKARSELINNWSKTQADVHGFQGKERDKFIKKQNRVLMGQIGWFDLLRQMSIDAWNSIKEWWGGTSEWWKNNVTEPIKKNWNEHVVDNLSKCWDKIKNSWKPAFNGIIGLFERLLNKIIDGINWLTSKANKISFDMPSWLGGGHFGINISPIQSASIPRLAQGAVLKGGDPMLAYLNDQPRGKTNIETPLNTMIQAFNQALSKNNNIPGNIIVHAEGDVAGIIDMLRFNIKQRDELIGTNYISDGVFS